MASRNLSRREFINFFWLASAGVLTVGLGGIALQVALPRRREGAFGGIFRLGKLSDLIASDAPLNVPAGKFWLVKTPQGLLALSKTCTHLDCLYNWNAESGAFLCPCHGSEFALDGAVMHGPAARALDRFVVQLQDIEGKTFSETSASDGSALAIPQDAIAAESDLQVTVDTGQIVRGKPHTNSA